VLGWAQRSSVAVVVRAAVAYNALIFVPQNVRSGRLMECETLEGDRRGGPESVVWYTDHHDYGGGQ